MSGLGGKKNICHERLNRKDEKEGFNPKIHEKSVDPARSPWDCQAFIH